jgi:DNA-binding transcriptional regulator YiaG
MKRRFSPHNSPALSAPMICRFCLRYRKICWPTPCAAPPKPMKKQEIIKLREQLKLSQPLFASLLNVSVKTVQAWEQGLRETSDAALKLLTIAKKHPEVLLA